MSVYFEKYDKKKGYRVCGRDMTAKLILFMPVLVLITHVISSVHGSFCGNWKQYFLFEKNGR